MNWRWTAGAVGLLVVALWWGYSQHQEAARLSAALRAEKLVHSSRENMAAALNDAERLLRADEALVGVVRAAARAAAEAAAEAELSKAAAEARDVADEFSRTGRVTESLRRAHRELGAE